MQSSHNPKWMGVDCIVQDYRIPCQDSKDRTVRQTVTTVFFHFVGKVEIDRTRSNGN